MTYPLWHFPKNPYVMTKTSANVMHFTKMMCATVPIMEQEESVRELVHEYVMNMFDNETGFDVELEEECGVRENI